MSSLTMREKKSENTLELRLAGTIDEDSNLSGASFSETRKVVLDMGEVTAINSCGIRDWIVWIHAIPLEVQIVYRNCRRPIVDQMNMVDGFLPPNATVESFFVPYFCEACGEVTEKLMRSGEDYGDGGIRSPAETSCRKCGAAAEVDVIENKYFRFLED